MVFAVIVVGAVFIAKAFIDADAPAMSAASSKEICRVATSSKEVAITFDTAFGTDDYTQDILAIKGLGQFEDFPAIVSLRRLIEDWYVSDFHIEDARNRQTADYSESLSTTGDNLAQVTKYIYDYHPERFTSILDSMKERVPGVDSVEAKLVDGDVVLRFQDGKFKNPFSSKFVSDGTIKMFTYLVLLSDPSPHALLCVEEPENQLYPQLLMQLAEEFRNYSNIGGQVFISTHSPDFLNAIRLEELFCLVKK